MFLIISVIVVGFVIYKLFTSVLPYYFVVPHQNWRERIAKVIKHDKPIYLNVGYKRSSYRRRLILASIQPSFYTNFRNNKIKLHPQDAGEDNQRFLNEMRRRGVDDPGRKLLYGFFHPYANNGGGGERVLWQAVGATLEANSRNIAVVYTTNIEAEPLQILQKAEDKFQVSGLDSSRIVFIYLRRFSHLIDGAYWKHFTLIGQLVGSMLLGLEALFELTPDIWIDTIGLPGSYLSVTFILRLPILAYVHYPIIQSDMFNKLKFKAFTTAEFGRFNFSVRDFAEAGKFVYWSMVYYLYVYLGSMVDVALANGSWTFNHISNIWSFNSILGHKLEKLFPPCGTETLTKETSLDEKRENKLLYIAQFRPEKRHALFIDEFAQFLKKNFANAKADHAAIPKLVFLGSCRTADDTTTLHSIQSKVEKAGLQDHVEFIRDCSYDEVVEQLSKAKFGLNAMWNEHFGIGVVEYLARGVVPLVHASAGPWLDIVTGWNDDENKLNWHNNSGFFFKSIDDPDFDPCVQEATEEGFLTFNVETEQGKVQRAQYPTFSELLHQIFIKSPELVSEKPLAQMRRNGLRLVKDKFSNEAFNEAWKKYVVELQELEMNYRSEKDDVVQVY